MNTSASLGLSNLEIVLLNQPVQQRTLKAMLGIKATICSAFSEITVENLCIEYRDFIAFRKRLRNFIDRKDSAAGWHTLMPMFDLSLSTPYDDYVRAEVRITPNIRGERHAYDFDFTIAEVSDFARSIDISLLSTTLNKMQV